MRNVLTVTELGSGRFVLLGPALVRWYDCVILSKQRNFVISHIIEPLHVHTLGPFPIHSLKQSAESLIIGCLLDYCCTENTSLTFDLYVCIIL